jgi:hypothetical protein
MATMRGIVDNVLTRLLQQKHAPKHWTRSEILAHANAVVGEFNLMTRQIQASATVSWSTTDNVHSCPSDAIAPLAIYHNGKAIRHAGNLENLDREAQWESGTETRIKLWVPLGLTQYIVYPRAASVGRTFTLHYLQAPNYADDTTVVAIPDTYIDGIEYGTYHRALFKEGFAAVSNSMGEFISFLDDAEQLAGRNFWRERPSWITTPHAKAEEPSMRDKK